MKNLLVLVLGLMIFSGCQGNKIFNSEDLGQPGQIQLPGPNVPSVPTYISSQVASNSWTFDSISGTTVFDSSGTMNGVAKHTTLVSGVHGDALSFTGNSNSYVEVSSQSQAQLNTNLTMMVQIKTINSSRTEGILSRYDATGIESGFILETLSNGVVAFRMGGNDLTGSAYVFVGSKQINDGQWHQVSVVVSIGHTVSIYVDASLDMSYNAASQVAFTSASLYIGAGNQYYTNDFTGVIDDVRIFNSALTNADVEYFFNN